MSSKPWIENYPKGIPSRIDIPDITLRDLIKETTDSYSSQDAIACFGHKLTFDDVDKYSDILAGYFQQKWQLKKGQHIAIMLPNILQFPVVNFALIKIGCVFVNINPLYTAEELKGILNDSQAIGIITLTYLAQTVETAIADCPNIKHTMVTDIADLHSFPKKQIVTWIAHYKRKVPEYSKDKFNEFSDAIKAQLTPDYANIDITSDDMAAIQYSSGTTGKPKGTILLHRNIIANISQVKAWMKGFNIDLNNQISIVALPLYHIFSLTVNLFFYYSCGGMQVLIPNPRDASSLVGEMKKYSFTTFFGVNTLYIHLLNNQKFRNLNFDKFKVCISGGMSTMDSVAKEWKEVTGVEIKEGYGMSEMSPVVSVNAIDDNPFNGTVGFALPNTDISIRDDKGNELPQGEIGEIWVTGPQKSPGFWNLPEITKNNFTDDGWLKTGDVGFLDDLGRLTISGRLKYMIIVSGFNVYPKEIEIALLEKSEISDAAIIGVPSEKTGEMVVAFITLKKGVSLTEEDVRSYCKTKLSAYKVPKKVIFENDLPKNTVGKIDIKKLYKEYADKYQQV